MIWRAAMTNRDKARSFMLHAFDLEMKLGGFSMPLNEVEAVIDAALDEAYGTRTEEYVDEASQ